MAGSTRLWWCQRGRSESGAAALLSSWASSPSGSPFAAACGSPAASCTDAWPAGWGRWRGRAAASACRAASSGREPGPISPAVGPPEPAAAGGERPAGAAMPAAPNRSPWLTGSATSDSCSSAGAAMALGVGPTILERPHRWCSQPPLAGPPGRAPPRHPTTCEGSPAFPPAPPVRHGRMPSNA